MIDQLLLEPSCTCLVILDLQNGIVEQLHDSETLINTVNSAAKDARSHGATIAWVRVALTEKNFAEIPKTSVMATMTSAEGRARLGVTVRATQLDERLPVMPEDLVVRRTRIGAFSTSDLNEKLRSRGINTLIIAGAVTSGAVLTTVREALDLDYQVVVLHDCTSDRNLEVHTFLIKNIFTPHAIVLATDELLWGK